MNYIQERDRCTEFVRRRPIERVNVHFLQLFPNVIHLSNRCPRSGNPKAIQFNLYIKCCDAMQMQKFRV